MIQTAIGGGGKGSGRGKSVCVGGGRGGEGAIKVGSMGEVQVVSLLCCYRYGVCLLKDLPDFVMTEF